VQRLSKAECLAFILSVPRTAKVAVVRPDGRPHVAPVWIDLDGEEILFTTGRQTAKGEALRRDGRIGICVDDETPPFAYVRIEGTASLSAEMGELHRWAGRIASRYMGADRADVYARRNAVEGELLVRVRPTCIMGWKGISD